MASPSPQSSPMPPPPQTTGPPTQQQSSVNQGGISFQQGSAHNFQEGQTQQQAYSSPLSGQTQPDSQSYQQMPSSLGITQQHQNFEGLQPRQHMQQQPTQIYSGHQTQMSDNLANIGQTEAVASVPRVQEPVPTQNGTSGPIQMNQVNSNGSLISPTQSLGMLIKYIIIFIL